MSELRLRFKFNPGRDGAPMDKLGQFTTQCEKFLRSMAQDLGIDAKKGDWLAKKFTNASVEFDSNFAKDVSEFAAQQSVIALNTITSENPFDVCNKGILSSKTLFEYASIGKGLDPDESYFIKIYDDSLPELEPEWREVTYNQSSIIKRLLETPVITYGALQAVPYSLTSGATPPFFHVRDLNENRLIKCFYKHDIYSQVHHIFENINNVVILNGEVSWDRAENIINEVNVFSIDFTRKLSAVEFDNIFGSIPDCDDSYFIEDIS